ELPVPELGAAAGERRAPAEVGIQPLRDAPELLDALPRPARLVAAELAIPGRVHDLEELARMTHPFAERPGPRVVLSHLPRGVAERGAERYPEEQTKLELLLVARRCLRDPLEQAEGVHGGGQRLARGEPLPGARDTPAEVRDRPREVAASLEVDGQL